MTAIRYQQNRESCRKDEHVALHLRHPAIVLCGLDLNRSKLDNDVVKLSVEFPIAVFLVHNLLRLGECLCSLNDELNELVALNGADKSVHILSRVCAVVVRDYRNR